MKESSISDQELGKEVSKFELTVSQAYRTGKFDRADRAKKALLSYIESLVQKKYREGELNELRATNKWIVNSELDDALFHKWCMHYSEREKTLESQLERKEQ